MRRRTKTRHALERTPETTTSVRNMLEKARMSDEREGERGREKTEEEKDK